MRRIREEDLRGGIVLFLRAKFAYVRDTICVRDVLPLGRQVDMDRAIRKCHVFGNDDLRATAKVLIDSKFPIHFTVARHSSLPPSRLQVDGLGEMSVNSVDNDGT